MTAPARGGYCFNMTKETQAAVLFWVAIVCAVVSFAGVVSGQWAFALPLGFNIVGAVMQHERRKLLRMGGAQ